MSEFPRTPGKRLPKRAQYDREPVYAVVDSAPICHVGFVQDGQPFVIPTIHAQGWRSQYRCYDTWRSFNIDVRVNVDRLASNHGRERTRRRGVLSNRRSR